MNKMNFEKLTASVPVLPWDRPVLHPPYRLFDYQGKIVTAQNFNYFCQILEGSSYQDLQTADSLVGVDGFYGIAYSVASLLSQGIFAKDPAGVRYPVFDTCYTRESIFASEGSFKDFTFALTCRLTSSNLCYDICQLSCPSVWAFMSKQIREAMKSNEFGADARWQANKLYRWFYGEVKDPEVVQQMIQREIKDYLERR